MSKGYARLCLVVYLTVLLASVASHCQARDTVGRQDWWTGKLKWGTILKISDLAELEIGVTGEGIVSLDDFEEWKAELKPGFHVIEVDLDEYRKEFKVAKEPSKSDLEQNLKIQIQELSVEKTDSIVHNWSAVWNGHELTSKFANHLQLKLKPNIVITSSKCFIIGRLLAYRSRIAQKELISSSNACLVGAHLHKINLVFANLRFAKLMGAGLKRADLRNANLRNADLRGAGLKRTDLRNADLRNADLRDADLECADMRDADMRDADLRDAHLRDAHLNSADLRDAVLESADLRDAHLNSADLRDAVLESADLRRVDLSFADMRSANLIEADLRAADLWAAYLGGAGFIGADMSHVRFERLNEDALKQGIGGQKSGKLRQLPSALKMISTRNLWQVVYTNHSYSLISMRDALKKAGLPSYARQLNHAAKHNKVNILYDEHGQRVIEIPIHSYLTYWLLEWPSDWGASPLKPVSLVFYFALGFAVLYFPAFFGFRGYTISRMGQDYEKYHQPRWYLVPFYSGLLSLICAFRFSWHEVEKGTWLTAALPKPILLKPVGWCRVVCGVQSVISKYLILLFLLNYFGGLFRD